MPANIDFAANNWCKQFTEHARFENDSSARIKKHRSCFKNVNMARFADLPEKELSFLLQDKDAENTKKATNCKVALTSFRSYLKEKGLSEGELITMFG